MGIYTTEGKKLEETPKWSNSVVLWLINCTLFNSFRIHETQNPGSKPKYKKFFSGNSEEGMQKEGDSEDEVEVEGAPTLHATRHDPLGRLSHDMRQHKLEAVVGSQKKKYP
jgi:hypothetical protein